MPSPEEFKKIYDRIKKVQRNGGEWEAALNDAIDLIDQIRTEPASNDYKAGFRACANMIDSLTIKPWYNTTSPAYVPWKNGFDFAVEHIKDIARRGADLVEGVPSDRTNKFPEDR